MFDLYSIIKYNGSIELSSLQLNCYFNNSREWCTLITPKHNGKNGYALHK